MLKAVIVDDEVLAVNLLVHFLKEMDGIRVVGAFTNEAEALSAIYEMKPDIIFLDIDMPELNGIQMAESIQASGIMTDIVYITAYDHYAIKAFEVNAVDYIMKPTDKERLIKTVQTIIKRRNRPPLVLLREESGIKAGLTAKMMGDFVLLTSTGGAVKWRTKKVKEFCAYLLHQEHPVHRLQVIEDLWQAVSVPKATSLLYSTVYQLRKVFNEQGFPNSITFVDDRYSLLVEVKTEVHEIKQILRDTRVEVSSVRRLLELIERDYLDEEDYPWSITQNEQLIAEIRRFLESFLLVHDGSRSAVETRELCLKKLLQLDPLNEQYCIQLMKHHLGLGANHKAKEIYKSFKKSVWTELGIDTQSEIDQVFKGLDNSIQG